MHDRVSRTNRYVFRDIIPPRAGPGQEGPPCKVAVDIAIPIGARRGETYSSPEILWQLGQTIAVSSISTISCAKYPISIQYIRIVGLEAQRESVRVSTRCAERTAVQPHAADEVEDRSELKNSRTRADTPHAATHARERDLSRSSPESQDSVATVSKD